jgi:hypothetical protein
VKNLSSTVPIRIRAVCSHAASLGLVAVSSVTSPRPVTPIALRPSGPKPIAVGASVQLAEPGITRSGAHA